MKNEKEENLFLLYIKKKCTSFKYKVNHIVIYIPTRSNDASRSCFRSLKSESNWLVLYDISLVGALPDVVEYS